MTTAGKNSLSRKTRSLDLSSGAPSATSRGRCYCAIGANACGANASRDAMDFESRRERYVLSGGASYEPRRSGARRYSSLLAALFHLGPPTCQLQTSVGFGEHGRRNVAGARGLIPDHPRRGRLPCRAIPPSD